MDVNKIKRNKKIRKNKCLSRRELAELSGVHEQTIRFCITIVTYFCSSGFSNRSNARLWRSVRPDFSIALRGCSFRWERIRVIPFFLHTFGFIIAQISKVFNHISFVSAGLTALLPFNRKKAPVQAGVCKTVNGAYRHRYAPFLMQLQTPLALPLGELSPQVTERVLQPVLNGNVNLFAHTTKIPVDIPVGKSQDLQAQSRQKCGTLCVICHALRLIMLRTIYFDNLLCRSAVKIHDKSANNPLFVNLHRVFAEKKKPIFGICRGCQLLNVAFDSLSQALQEGFG